MTTKLKLLLAGLVLAASAQIATAQTTIYIVASNGDRTATQTAISKLLAPGWVYQGISGAGNTSSSGNLSIATDSNFGAWNGTYQGNPVIIKTSFSGALAGIKAVAGKDAGVTARFVATNGTGTGTVPNPLTSSNPADYEEVAADFGFSTNFQSTSPFNPPSFQGVNYAPIIEENVGISPLGFYASPGFPGSPSNPRPGYVPNITTQLIQQLYTTGYVSLAQFTGDWEQDGTEYVFAIGRNTDAGQRFGAYLENQFDKTSDVKVWFPTVSGGTTSGNITYGGTVTSHQLWPVAQQPGQLPVPLGSGGYNSGANLARALTLRLTSNAWTLGGLLPDATGGYYVGYVTPGDANNRVLGANGVVPVGDRGVALRLNGVELTTANVKNGTYTAWLYNRIIKPQSGLGGLKLTFADALRDQIRDVDAVAGGGIIDDATVKVQRFTDGGAVISK